MAGPVGFELQNWMSAFGVQNLDFTDFSGSFSISDGELPGVSMSATGVTLPSGWDGALGVVQGAPISLTSDFVVSQPVLGISISPPPGAQPGVALQPLAIDPGLGSTVINSLDVNSASLWLVPFGGPGPSGDTVPPGASVAFSATVDGVSANVLAAVTFGSSPSVIGHVSVAPYALGTVTVGSTVFFLNLNASTPAFGFTGGISYDSDTYGIPLTLSFSAKVSLMFGSTANQASITLSGATGYPGWLNINGSFVGSVSGDGGGPSGASISAWATTGRDINRSADAIIAAAGQPARGPG